MREILSTLRDRENFPTIVPNPESVSLLFVDRVAVFFLTAVVVPTKRERERSRDNSRYRTIGEGEREKNPGIHEEVKIIIIHSSQQIRYTATK